MLHDFGFCGAVFSVSEKPNWKHYLVGAILGVVLVAMNECRKWMIKNPYSSSISLDRSVSNATPLD